MKDSILNSIKKLLGIADENPDFDVDLILDINTVLMVLRQIGVGPSSGFAISDDSSTWFDFLGSETDVIQFNAVKSYVYLKTKKLFDPPTGGALMEAMNKNIEELEYRLYAEAHWPTNI